jgi:hypothetical protein
LGWELIKRITQPTREQHGGIASLVKIVVCVLLMYPGVKKSVSRARNKRFVSNECRIYHIIMYNPSFDLAFAGSMNSR